MACLPLENFFNEENVSKGFTACSTLYTHHEDFNKTDTLKMWYSVLPLSEEKAELTLDLLPRLRL